MLYRKPWFVLAITLALTSQRSAVQAAAAVFGLVLVLLCAGLPAVAVSGDAVLTGSVAPAPANHVRLF